MKRIFTFCSVAGLLLSGLVAQAQITPSPWVRIGPKGDLVSQEQSIGVNGRIRSVEIRDLGAGDFYIYAGASSGGLWRSQNFAGPSVWTPLGDRLPNPSVGALAVHPGNTDDILVGTGDWKRYDGNGLYHTTDAGLTWNTIFLPAAPRHFFRILFFPGNANIVLAASDAGIFRSEHGPDNSFEGWALVLAGNVTDLVIDPSNPDIQYAWRAAGGFLAGGVYKSVNGGKNWMRFTSDSDAPGDRVGRGSISICRDFPNNVVFAYETNCFMADVLLSTDSGSGWSSIVANLFDNQGPWNFGPNNDEDCHAQAIAFKPNDPSTIFIGAADLAMTSNQGEHWDPLQTPKSPHQDYHQLYFSAVTGDNGLWQCNDGGIYLFSFLNNSSISFNGNNQTGLQVSQLNSMDAVHNVRVVGNQDDQVSGSKNGGQNWFSYGCCDGQATAVTFEIPGIETFWSVRSSAGIYGNVFKEFIGFNEWNVSDPGPLAGLFFNRIDARVYSLNANSALVSRLSSDTTQAAWNYEIGLPAGSYGPAGDRLRYQTLFFWRGVQPGYLTVVKKSGSSWFILWDAHISTNAIQSVFASTERPGESWAALRAPTNSQILHTMDDWQTSSDITGDLSSYGKVAWVWDLAVMPFNRQVIFVATETGVFFTQNGGVNWQRLQSGLPIVQCRVLRYVTDFSHNGTDKLVVGTFGHGMYELSIPRLPLLYVDPRNGGYVDGSFEHPVAALNTGISTTPNGGTMALNGMTTYLAPATLNKPMTITAYEAAAFLTK